MQKDQQDTIHTLWDELADFDAARSDEALTHLMEELCSLTGAWNISWVGAVRLDTSIPTDPLKGWRPRTTRFLNPSPQLDKGVREQMAELEQSNVDITTLRNAEGAGTFRVNRLCDMVRSEWFKSAYYKNYYLNLGKADAIWASFPVTKDAESIFGIYSAPDRPPFTEAERDVVAYTLRGIKWFHRQLMLSHGLLAATAPLTQREHRVLHLLLTELSEKQIAETIGRSYHTVHECVTSIYRKFGVNNRSALMALWLGKSPT